MRYLILLFASLLLFAEEVKISADKFQADEVNKIAVFEGNVKLIKGKDLIKAEKLTILFDNKNKPIEYSAEGNPIFQFVMKDKTYKGKADKIVYTPNDGKYSLIGDVFVKEEKENRKIYGDKLTIDKATGKITIKGKKNEPVRFIFQVEEKQ